MGSLVGVLLVAAFLAAGLPSLELDNSIDSMTGRQDPDRSTLQSKHKIFGSDDLVSIALEFDDPFSREALSVTRQVARDLEALPFVSKVDSIATTEDIREASGGLSAEPVIGKHIDPLNLTHRELEEVRSRILANDIWRGLLVSEDRTRSAVQVRLDEGVGSSGQDPIRDIRALLDGRELAGSYSLAGHPYMTSEIAASMQRDLRRLLPFAVAVMALALLIGLRSPALVLVMTGSTLLSVGATLGAMGWLGVPVTILSSTCPTILVAIATAYFMHLSAAYQDEIGSSADPAGAGSRALERTVRPTILAGITTALGFGALWFSEIPMVRGFGIAIVVGLLLVVGTGYFGLAAALMILVPMKGRSGSSGRAYTARFLFAATCVSARSPGLLLLAAMGATGVAIWFGAGVRIDSSGPEAFHESSAFKKASVIYQKHFGGDVAENLYLETRDGGIMEPSFLRSMIAFQEEVEAFPAVGATISIADHIVRMHRALDDDPESGRDLPEDRKAVAQYLLLYSLSADLEEFADLVDPTYSHARVLITASVPSSSASAELRRSLEDAASRHFGPKASTVVLSTEILLSQAAERLAREQLVSFGVVLALILLVVGIGLRSWEAPMILCLPNLLPIALYLGFMGAVGIALSESTAVIGVIALGIAVDGSVHLFAATDRSQKVCESVTGAVAYAMQRTGVPIVLAGGTIVAGFGVLTLSDFRILSHFGALTALTMVLCLLSDLLILPAQVLFVRARTSRSGVASCVLLETEDSSVCALELQDLGDQSAFRLVGEEANWRDWREVPLVCHSVAGGPARRGIVTALEEVSSPAIRVTWRRT